MVSGPMSTRTAERWAVVVDGVAVTVTLEEPESRRPVVSGAVRKPALAPVVRSRSAAHSVSLCDGSSANVSVAPGRTRFRARVPTPGAFPVPGRTVVTWVVRGGQTRSVDHWSGWRSMSAIGSRSMPLS